MIKHIVLWQLKDSAGGRSKAENANKIKEEISNLKNKIPQIISIEAGINILPASDSFDVVLNAEFANQADLDIYQVHPDHVKFKGFIKDLVSDKRFIDYQA